MVENTAIRSDFVSKFKFDNISNSLFPKFNKNHRENFRNYNQGS